MHFTSSVVAVAAFTSGAFAKTIPIQVGQMGLAFTPNTTTAEKGDVLEFSFYPKMHNVAQGSFNTPCGTGAVENPFFSGGVPVASGKSTTTFSVTVNDTNPMWMYCSVPMHCQLGMVMTVNPPTSGDQTLEAYRTAAAKTGNSTTPFTAARGGVLSQASNSGSTTTGSRSTATSTGARSTSTKNVAVVENSPMGWGMWTALAGAAVFGAVAL